MMEAIARKWGDSIGIVIPTEKVKELNIHPNDSLLFDIEKKGNPLVELFGIWRKNPITREEFQKTRKELESKFMRT